MDPLLTARLTFILGLTNIITGLMVFFSCRCLAGSKITSWLFKYPWYQRFYNKHGLIWKFFFVSVLFHSLLAITTFGWP